MSCMHAQSARRPHLILLQDIPCRVHRDAQRALAQAAPPEPAQVRVLASRAAAAARRSQLRAEERAVLWVRRRDRQPHLIAWQLCPQAPAHM